MKGLAIIGAGGFGREAYYHALGQMAHYGTAREIRFFAEDAFADITANIHPLRSFDPNKWEAVIAIGDTNTRQRIANSLPANTEFYTIIHPSAQQLTPLVKIGSGSIICAGAVLTTNISIGAHVHINLNATIGHDCRIGNCVTIAPSANISGNVTIGDRCNIGTNAAIREGVTIAPDCIIGMGAVVLQSITEAGTYVGVPAKKVK
jgi:sugar O-acyltransferase (sialic acid O-acetyltransferase NeuD family)